MKLTLSTSHVSSVTGKLISVASYLNGLPRSIDHDRKKLGKLIVVDVRNVGEGSCIVQGVLCLLQRPILKFWSIGLRWWGSPWQIIPSEGFWSRMSAWRATAFLNFPHRIGFSMSELYRKMDGDFSGTISWNTQPNSRVIFKIPTALFVTILWRPFARLLMNLAVCIRALFTKPASIFGLAEKASGGCHFSQKCIGR